MDIIRNAAISVYAYHISVCIWIYGNQWELQDPKISKIEVPSTKFLGICSRDLPLLTGLKKSALDVVVTSN